MRRGSKTYRLLDRHVGIVVLRAASIFNRARKCPPTLRTIGILSSPTIGDTVLTSGAVMDVKQAFPECQIIFFSTPGNSAAAKLILGVDTIREIDILRPYLTIRTLRDSKLDAILDFTQWQRITALYAGLSGARYRLGFRSRNQCRHWLYDEWVEHSTECHEIENFRALVRALGAEATSQPLLNVHREEALAQTRPIVFHPWAAGDQAFLREWAPQRWVDLAKRLASNDTFFFITGGPADLRRSHYLMLELKRAGLSAETFIAHDGLQGVSRLLLRSELVVSVNTGIMHLAALIGAPTVALNGPTATHRWGPVGERSRSVEPRGGGGGFLHFGYEFAGNPTDTMERIHVDDVFSAAQLLLPRLQQQGVPAGV